MIALDWLKHIYFWILSQIKRVKFGRDTIIFLFFLVLSTIFWLLNQLSKDTSAELLYPVRFQDRGSKRIIVNDLPDHLSLQVKGQGYTLLKYKLKPRLTPLTIDFRSFPLRPVKTGNIHAFYLLSSYVRGVINDQLGRRLELTGIRPDTLYFVFDSLIERKIPVLPDVKITLARQYIYREPLKVFPDTVKVSGPSGIIDTLQNIPTEYVAFKDVRASFTKILLLRKIEKISIPVKKVKIRVGVEQFTEAVFDIPLKPLHVPDSLILHLFPPTVKITCHVGLSRYKNVLPELFTAQVDYQDIKNDRTGKVSVRLAKKPDYIDAIHIDPGKVEYIIEKKQ